MGTPHFAHGPEKDENEYPGKETAAGDVQPEKNR